MINMSHGNTPIPILHQGIKQFSFKSLVYKFFIFFIPIKVCVLSLFLINVDYDQKYRIPKDVTTVFVGDSHIYYAISSSGEYANYGVNSQSIFFSYNIVKKLVTLNDHITCVVIGLAPYNILDLSYRYTEKQFAKYFHLFSTQEKKDIFTQKKIKNYLNFSRAMIKEKLKDNLYAYDEHKYLLPKLDQDFKNVNQYLSQRIDFQYYESNVLRTKTARDSSYYLKLQAYLNSKNIRLMYVNTPAYKGYTNLIPKSVKAKFLDFVRENKLPFKDLSAYKELDLSAENFIRDGDHLSRKGAIQFTNYLLCDRFFCERH